SPSGGSTGATDGPVVSPGPSVAVVMLGRSTRDAGVDVCRGLDDRLEEVHDPRAPAGGDVVVQLDDVPLLHGAHLAPAWTLGHGAGVLAAALGVGEEDQVGIGVDQELCRQLRVAAGLGRPVGGVGHVLQAGEAVDLADEGVGGDAVERVVQLVVVGQ